MDRARDEAKWFNNAEQRTEALDRIEELLIQAEDEEHEVFFNTLMDYRNLLNGFASIESENAKLKAVVAESRHLASINQHSFNCERTHMMERAKSCDCGLEDLQKALRELDAGEDHIAKGYHSKSEMKRIETLKRSKDE